MTLFVTLVWMAALRSGRYGYDSHAWRVARMAIAGRTIISTVVWFQFLAVCLITVIMLSTSISEEIYHRTLGVLMTTPIRSPQIVVGKLFSKLLQLLMLLAASLPVLGIVRVFGGVPWSYVVAALGITLTTAVLLAAVTMFFSILCRRAFVSILLALLTAGVIYGLLPLLIVLFVEATDLDVKAVTDPLVVLFLATNPFAAMTVTTVLMIEPRGATGLPFFQWWVVCLVNLGLAAAVLAACVAMVRRVALRQAAGATRAGPTAAPPDLPPAHAAQTPPAGSAVPEGVTPPPVLAPAAPPAPPLRDEPTRRITGSPVVWREVRARWFRRRWLFWLVAGIVGGILLLIYALVGIEEGWDDDDSHAVTLFLMTAVAAVATGILAATNVTSEKEANSWEILLATPLTGREILVGKVVGVLRRCLPIWLLPIAHVLLFVLIGYIRLEMVAFMLLITAAVVAVLGGAGLYFGVRFRRTTTAVILNLGLGIALWGALPALLALAAEASPTDRARNDLRNATEYVVDANPFVQAGFLSERAARNSYRVFHGGGSANRQTYRWPGAGALNAEQSVLYQAFLTGGYVFLAGLFLLLARRNLRRRI